MADLVERRTACMCQGVEIGSYAVSVSLKAPAHMQDYSANRVAAGLSPDIDVDACLVGEIRTLWSKGIRTYGCCCGHNKVRGMINVHEDDAGAMLAMGYEQWPIEEGYHPWTFYPQSTRADVAALEAEASEGERRGLERAAEVIAALSLSNRRAADASRGINRRAAVEAATLWLEFEKLEKQIRALIPAPAQRELDPAETNQLSRPKVGIPEAPVRDGWMPIETAPKNRKILAGYHNPLGNWRTFAACYHTHLPWSDEENPEDGSEYAPEGWYEESDTAETIYRTRDDPTHWMPIPAPPQDNREG